jgi:electron transfer flavoprotein beta subunit
MGADAAVHIETDLRTDQELQPLAVAKLLAWLTKEKKPGAWILGKQVRAVGMRRRCARDCGAHRDAAPHPARARQAIDDDSAQTGQMLAALLGWPQAAFASKLDFESDARVTVTREIDGGLQRIAVPLPAVFTADLRLNEPRYATLPNIMKAKKKPIEAIAAAATGVDIAPRFTVLKVAEPPVRKGGKKVASLDDLVTALKGKGLLA